MPDTIGFIDGLEGAYVRGWAIADDKRPAAITIRDPAGKLLARGQALLDRPDVAQFSKRSPNCGFRIPVRQIGKAGALHIFGDGVELAGSPVPVGPGQYDGGFVVSEAVATGWVTERAERFRGARIELRDQDGVLLGEAEALVDENVDDPLHRPARFSVPLGQACFGRSDLIVRAFANGVRFAEAQGRMGLDGYLDALTERRCSGWLLCPDAPTRQLSVTVWRDGIEAGCGTCHFARDDVRDRYPHAYRVGFEITLDSPAAEDRRSTVYSIRLTGTETELFGGPLTVEGRSDAIEAARRMARLAQADPALTAQDRAVLRRALGAFINQRRHGAEQSRVRAPARPPDGGDGRRLCIVIPCYRGVEVTAACIASVLSVRDPARDTVVLINDCSPEPRMAVLLEAFARHPNVLLLTNAENQGFVRAANRGLALCRRGDVLLLNSDTRVFPGVLEELCRIAASSPDIGTITPLSNNATIFSYPHIDLRGSGIADMEWADVAALAQEANGGMAIDVPTGHGFCMLIRREALDLAGQFDEAFGRGYGEENDLCQRLADMGFRNVAAPGAFVEHRESVSFGADKKTLIEANLARLGRSYPEYAAIIAEHERHDGLRRARWPLDAARLRQASANGASFAVVVTNWLGGGSRRALAEIEAAAGYAGADKLALTCREDGVIELSTERPSLRAIFGPDETGALFDLLSAARITRVAVHQVLGFPPAFIEDLTGFVAGRHSVFYAHDFYPICQRVTMIDAVGQFCDVAPTATCVRCLTVGGPHEASRLDAWEPEEHRRRMGALLGAFRHVVAPSESAAAYLRRAWPGLEVMAVPHPEPRPALVARVRAGESQDVVLLGGIGPHKGSETLLAIAGRARLTHPDLRFHVIGHTNIDSALRQLKNVTITGFYEPGELDELLTRIDAQVALFLHNWPETYSYTLSEAVAHGLFPLVPDLGAPAERVREAGWGAVFGFPVEPNEVLAAIAAAIARPADQPPRSFVARDAAARHRAIMGVAEPATAPPRKRPRSRAA